MSRAPARAGGGAKRRGPGTRATPARAPGGARAGAAGGEAERLQKMLARAGLASRREAEGWIRAGRLTVNGAPATLGMRVRAHDQVHLDGRLVRAQKAHTENRVYICHRSPGESLRTPEGVPAEGEAPALRPGMLERLPRRAGRRFMTVSPMPRVDGGLELVTSDGELALKLQRGVHRLTSEFGVRVRGELNAAQLDGIAAGLLDSGEHLAVERCEAAGGEGANRWYTLVARGASGKDVRQLFERGGALVSRVLRTHLGPLTLERSLGRGRVREVTDEELAALLRPPADPQP